MYIIYDGACWRLVEYIYKGLVDTMILVTTATEFEMNALRGTDGKLLFPCLELVTGVGLCRTSLTLTRFLCETDSEVDGIVNLGIGGAYFSSEGNIKQAGVLDICLAEREVFGDFGICMGDDIEYLPKELVGSIEFDLKNPLYHQCASVLHSAGIEYHSGTFISVNSVTGTRTRGEGLQRSWNGLCENMEGAAVAQVASMFALPLFELRSISNMVEDRNPAAWCLQEACEKMGFTAKKILKEIT